MAPISNRGANPQAGRMLGTVLVTGGCGFIGSHIVEAFARDPECKSVVAASRRPTKFRIDGVKYIACDVTDEKQLEVLIDDVQPTVIVHTVSPGVWATDKEHYRVSYLATKQLVQLAQKHPAVRALVFTSSFHAIPRLDDFSDSPVEENASRLNDLQNGMDAYAKTKGAACAVVLAGNTPESISKPQQGSFENQLLTSVLHISGLYGPRDHLTLPELLKVSHTIGTRFQLGDNSAPHEWVYVDNAAEVHVLAAKALLDGKHASPEMRVDGEDFFITDGSPMSFWGFVRQVWTADGDAFSVQGGKPIVIPIWIMLFIGSVSDWLVRLFGLPGYGRRHIYEHIHKGHRLSIEKARKRLGYKPVCDTEEGIRRTVDWFHNNKDWEDQLKR